MRFANKNVLVTGAATGVGRTQPLRDDEERSRPILARTPWAAGAPRTTSPPVPCSWPRRPRTS